MSNDSIDVFDLDSLQRELATRVSRFARTDGVHATPIGGLAAIRASAPSQPISSVYEPSLCIVVQGRKHARLRDETYIYDPLNYLVVSVTLPIIGQIVEATLERPYLCLRIGVDRKLIGELLLQAGPTLVQRPASERGLYVAKTDGALLDAVVRLVRLLERPRDAHVLSPLILGRFITAP